MIKCIAIGNRIMGDDSIGLRILEIILSKLNSDKIVGIFGETDIDYALSEINEDDIIFILDSTFYGLKPGDITITPIDKHFKSNNEIFSQHQPSIIDYINIYKLNVKGYIIGIEIENIDFNLEISSKLQSNLLYISNNIYNLIKEKVEEFNYA